MILGLKPEEIVEVKPKVREFVRFFSRREEEVVREYTVFNKCTKVEGGVDVDFGTLMDCKPAGTNSYAITQYLKNKGVLEREYAFISSFYPHDTVLPPKEFQRKGIGKYVMDRVLEDIRGYGLNIAVLYIDGAPNIDYAEALYKKCGFDDIGFERYMVKLT